MVNAILQVVVVVMAVLQVVMAVLQVLVMVSVLHMLVMVMAVLLHVLVVVMAVLVVVVMGFCHVDIHHDLKWALEGASNGSRSTQTSSSCLGGCWGVW